MKQIIKKTFSAVLLTAAICSTTSSALAHSYYLRADAGYSHPKRWAYKPDGAVIGQVGAGYVFNSKFRSDVTASYRGEYKYSASEGTVSESQKSSSLALMFNAYFTPKKFGKFSPYVMAGAGIAINELKDGNINNNGTPEVILGDTKRNFAWQVGAGALVDINKNVTADLQYRYMDSGTIATKNSGNGNNGIVLAFGAPLSGKLKSHEFTLGLQFKI